jgi:hypothetical protein
MGTTKSDCVLYAKGISVFINSMSMSKTRSKALKLGQGRKEVTMELRIDKYLTAFVKWQGAQAELHKRIDKDKGAIDEKTPEYNAERVAAMEVQEELDVFVKNSMFYANLTRADVTEGMRSPMGNGADSTPRAPFDNVAPLPKCTCGHFRHEHRQDRFECGNIACEVRCQQFTKVLETTRNR